MPYERETWPKRNWWIAGFLVAQVVLFFISMDELTISILCTVPQNGMPHFVAWGHAMYLVLLIVGLAGLFVRRIGLFYLAALPIALLFLPLQFWAVDAGYFSCDGP